MAKLMQIMTLCKYSIVNRILDNLATKIRIIGILGNITYCSDSGRVTCNFNFWDTLVARKLDRWPARSEQIRKHYPPPSTS